MNVYASSPHPSIRFARLVFSFAGILGLIEVVPLYFYEQTLSRNQPPPLTHPEFYYGFLGVVVAWQVAFLIISSDPARYQPLLPALFLEKLLYPAALVVLYMDGRLQALSTLFGGAIDLCLLALFVTAWLKLNEAPADPWAIAAASKWW
jgi:hypothetical protein